MTSDLKLYDVLGLPKSSSQLEIKKAYKSLALQFHPDKNPTGKEKFQEIHHAYTILGDTEKRQRYDRGVSVDTNYSSAFDDEDFHSALFAYLFRRFASGASSFHYFSGSSFSFQSRYGGPPNSGSPFNFQSRYGGPPPREPPYVPDKPPRKQPRRCSDITFILNLSPEELRFGVVKEVFVQRTAPCGRCSGTGDKQRVRRAFENCIPCETTGFTKYSFDRKSYNVCRKCDGYGRYVPQLQQKRECSACSGSMIEVEIASITVTVSPGLKEGHILTLRGEGNQVPFQISGDLLVTLRIGTNTNSTDTPILGSKMKPVWQPKVKKNKKRSQF